MKAEETPGQRARRLREEKGLSQSAVSHNIGGSAAALHKFECGAAKTFRKIFELAELFGVSAQYIMNGEEKNDDNEIIEKDAYIPLIHWESVSILKEINNPKNLNQSNIIKFINISGLGSFSKNSYALIVKTESMRPIFRRGDYIIIDPEKTPSAGDFFIYENEKESLPVLRTLIIEEKKYLSTLIDSVHHHEEYKDTFCCGVVTSRISIL